jgi:dolichol-phosphate mannosyltransferase
MAGLVVGALSLVLTFVYLVGSLLLRQDWPAGFATTTILLLVSLSMNAIFLGILGEYVGRLFVQAKHGSAPIVQASLNFGSGPAARGADAPAERRPAAQE